MKRFLKWIGYKQHLDVHDPHIPLVSEGQIWWASLGENIGREISGKSEVFTRPVLIYKKFSRDFYFVIPFTSQCHEGSWYIPYHHRERKMICCLHQARSIDYRRLDRKFGEIDRNTFLQIQKGFENLYKR